MNISRFHDMPVALLRVLLVLSLFLAADAHGQAPNVDGHDDYLPDAVAVRRCGPAWRYPQDGWIVLHIEGTPYDRGWQHGQLMAREIVDFIKVMAEVRSHKDPQTAWLDYRRLVDALFLRRYAQEYLEEMKGIADGAAAAGAKYDKRRIDLVDIAIINSGAELAFLDDGLEATSRGLERQKFKRPQYSTRKPQPREHCSAFVATGPATADGKPVLGHITMSSLGEVSHYNVWLDIQPTDGHRMVIQTSPGGIQSGLDYYINSAGLIIAETTIRQTRFNAEGQALASRIRQAVQYAGTIDQVVTYLTDRSNGLYTNQWLLADLNTNEIAMFELGTYRSQLWRSSRDEWLGDTRGFYWGCNNSQSLEVLKETTADLGGKPANLTIYPKTRDKAWLRLFADRRGTIGEAFGFEAFTTPPLAAFPSCDAKFTTAPLAKKLQSWALFGPPLGRTWDPAPQDRAGYPDVRPLVSNDWTLLKVATPPASETSATLADVTPFPKDDPKPNVKFDAQHPAAWRGTLLPATDADVWLAAAFAEYEKIVALEQACRTEAETEREELSRSDRDLIDLALFRHESRWRAALRRTGADVALRATRPDRAASEWYDIASGKGVLLLHRLRERLGLEPFVALMDAFGAKHAGHAVSTEQFIAHCRDSAGADAADLVAAGVESADPGDEPADIWTIFSFEAEPERSLIVYGTKRDKAAQRESAELLQREIGRRFSNATIPIQADTEVSEEELKSRHLLLVGRPAANQVTERIHTALPVQFTQNSFRVRNETWTDAGSAVICAADNPFASRYSVVVFAGLGAEATWNCVQHLDADEDPSAQVMVFPARGERQKFRARLAQQSVALP
ncbi:MAG: hypothetical protein EHM42_03995 [Planctomycetaceae bacterium]|nr:MAG: hypothetical protein EHM42_03995 [Planctomycetaceae bacterium]